jgi:hypothetical protein
MLLFLATFDTHLFLGQHSCIVVNIDLISVLSNYLNRKHLFLSNRDFEVAGIESFRRFTKEVSDIIIKLEN